MPVPLAIWNFLGIRTRAVARRRTPVGSFRLICILDSVAARAALVTGGGHRIFTSKLVCVRSRGPGRTPAGVAVAAVTLGLLDRRATMANC